MCIICEKAFEKKDIYCIMELSVGEGGGIVLERTIGPWDYRMQPNKLLELVKNVGNMEQEGTGYFVDSESEMLTILEYLNYGETTHITEAMIAQIDEAVKKLETKRLKKDGEEDYSDGRKLGQDEYENGPKLGEDTHSDGRKLGLEMQFL